MKLREYGYIIWKLANKSDADEDLIGNIAYDIAPLVEDWSKDNEVSDSNNADWLTEPYNDWVDAKEKSENK